MLEIALIILAFAWVAATCMRIYRQARFYQIDEYKSNRYLRWWLGARERYLPQRVLIAGLVGGVLIVLMSEGGALLPVIIGFVTALGAGWPPKEREIKKPFRSTPRARRLLGAAFVLAAIVIAFAAFAIIPLSLDGEFRVLLLTAAGILALLAAPLLLMLGNLLMMPVEALFRRRFLAQAKGVIQQINPTVIGITGSYGKTTTKNYIAEILNGRYKAYATPKSYNTVMGICLAINNDLADNFAVDYFVVEMGAYFQGEIRRICDLTPPSISVVVEVGPQHLERFGTLENTATAKYEIIKALPQDGVGVFNWDNPYVREMYERGYPNTRLAVSKTISPDALPEGGPRFIASDIHESLEGLRFTVTDTLTGNHEIFTTALLGEHNVTNLLLATAVAVHEGMSLKEVAFRVRQLKPAESRLVRQSAAGGITIINDAYSANPAGVVSALKVLSMHTGGRRLLVTPGMIELAQLHEAENRKLGEIAAQHATDVILVGEERTRPIKSGLLEAGFAPDHLQVVDTLTEAINWYKTHLSSGDTVLFLNDLPDTY